MRQTGDMKDAEMILKIHENTANKNELVALYWCTHLVIEIVFVGTFC